MSPNIAKYRPISPNVAQYRPISPNVAQYRLVSPNIAYYYLTSPNTAYVTWEGRRLVSHLVMVYDIEITSWLVSAYDFYSRVVKDR